MTTTMEVCSSALRGIIIAPPGYKLIVADWSNIEGRALAWLAGEEWKLKAYRDFDEGLGADLYSLTYARTFNVSIEQVTRALRQIGKVMELAFGYGGGIGAWITFAVTFGLDLDKLADLAHRAIPDNILEEAENFYIWYREQGNSTQGLNKKTFIACDSIKRLWRAEHSHISTYWEDMQNAVEYAITHPNKLIKARMHVVYRGGEWLRISLPSNRCLCYPAPKFEQNKISYMGINQFTRKWERLTTYGGKLVENITQAVARDILADAMLRIEDAGYSIVLTVHDEPITETPDTSDFSAEHLCEIMEQPPMWAKDFPLAAEGFETYRYRKPD